MRKINYIKFILDFLMGIIFALLFNKNVLGGLKFHEIAGLAIGFAVLVHIILNIKWVKNVTKSIFNKRLGLRTRIGYILNVLLLIDMAMIIISGICISKILFPGLTRISGIFNETTHIGASYIGLGLIGIHLGLHWKWVMNVFKKIVRLNSSKKILGYISKVVAIFIVVFGIYSMVSTNYFSKVTQIITIGSSQNMGHGGPGEGDFQSHNMNPQKNNISSNNDQNKAQGNTGINSYHHEGGEGGDQSIIGMLASSMTSMGAFAVFTYYIDSLLIKKEKLKVNI